MARPRKEPEPQPEPEATAAIRAEARADTLQSILERMMDREPRTLDERIAAVQAQLEDVPRRGHAEVTTKAGAKYAYDYILEADLMSGIRPLLAEHGVAVYYSDELLRWSNGTAEVRVDLTFAANGEQRVCSATGTGSDTGDKAANKAKTSAVRYILWKTFLQPSDDDPEQENVSVNDAAKAAGDRQTAHEVRAGARTARTAESGDTPARLVEGLTRLALDLDSVQGRTLGSTLGEITDAVRAEHEVAPGQLPQGQLVAIGQALRAHLEQEREKSRDPASYTPTKFELPRS